MKSIGMYIGIAGIASIVLYFMDMNLNLLMWIDSWGETVGWIIRFGLLGVGGAIYFLTPSEDDEDGEEAIASADSE